MFLYEGNEYALARTERKTTPGYSGFSCEWAGVSLEEDLSRRDLTINSIAKDLDTGEIIDPFNGRQDIELRLLRPTTEHFKEDPIRVLRAARFLARYPEFEPSKSLYTLCREVAPELEHCAPERVWKELEKALSETEPSRFFNFLSVFKVFSIWEDLKWTKQKPEHHPEIWCGLHTELVINEAAKANSCPEVVFACLCHDFGKPECFSLYGNALGHEEVGLKHINEFCDKYKVPNSYRDLALLVCKQHTKVHSCLGRSSNDWMRPKSIMKLFEETRALQQPERFYLVLDACECDAKGRGSAGASREKYSTLEYKQKHYLTECLEAVLSLDTKPIAQALLDKGTSGTIIGLEIRAARISAIRGVQHKWKKN